MNYVLRFTGNISWEGQSNGLPPKLYAFLIFEGYQREMFNDAMEKQLRAFIAAQGMAAQREQGKVIDVRQVPQDRIFVPMRWIVSLEVDVVNMTGELSNPDGEGVERLNDGSEPVKQ
jgi:hypothetical protein